MAIVPNLNGVPISAQVPLVDPRNLSVKERRLNDDVYKSTTNVAVTVGNNTVVTASQLRNGIKIINPITTNEVVYLSTTPMSATGQGIPLYPGNGFEFRGQTAQMAFYAWSAASQTLVVMAG